MCPCVVTFRAPAVHIEDVDYKVFRYFLIWLVARRLRLCTFVRGFTAFYLCTTGLRQVYGFEPTRAGLKHTEFKSLLQHIYTRQAGWDGPTLDRVSGCARVNPLYTPSPDGLLSFDHSCTREPTCNQYANKEYE